MWFKKKSKLIIFFSLLAERHWPSPVSKTSQNDKTRKFYTYCGMVCCTFALHSSLSWNPITITSLGITSQAFDWWSAADIDHPKPSYLKIGSLALSQSDHWVIGHGFYQTPAHQIAQFDQMSCPENACLCHSSILPFQDKGGDYALVNFLDMYVITILLHSFGRWNSLDLKCLLFLSLICIVSKGAHLFIPSQLNLTLLDSKQGK